MPNIMLAQSIKASRPRPSPNLILSSVVVFKRKKEEISGVHLL